MKRVMKRADKNTRNQKKGIEIPEKFEFENKEFADSMRALTEKEQLFVREYLVDLNATAACKRSTYSSRTAHVIGNELLKKPKIQKAVQVAMNLRAEQIGVNAQWVLMKLKKVAQVSLAELPYAIDEDEDGDEIKRFKFDASGANRSLELLGKHLVLFTDQIKHQIDDIDKITAAMSTKDAANAYMQLIKKGK